MHKHNPTGTNGFAFLEFSTPNPELLTQQFLSLGLTPIGKHKDANVTIFQQNDIRFLINTTPGSMAQQFATLHGPCVTAMGFRVKNVKTAYNYILENGATPYLPEAQTLYGLPAIYGVGQSLIYLLHEANEEAWLQQYFSPVSHQSAQQVAPQLTYIDHVTHNLYRGELDKWADFYTRLFNFREVRYFDIEGRMTGLKSRAMTSPCDKIRIPLNESSDDKSQIEEFLKDFKGEGIQHIALGTDDIYHSVTALRNNHLEFLDTPETYYDLIEKRLPNHGEPVDTLRQQRILIDGNTKEEKKLLLQIFTKNMLGPVFFEIIQRKGDEGFGEGNFRALFESIELDQIRRGVLTVEEV